MFDHHLNDAHDALAMICDAEQTLRVLAEVAKSPEAAARSGISVLLANKLSRSSARSPT